MLIFQWKGAFGKSKVNQSGDWMDQCIKASFKKKCWNGVDEQEAFEDDSVAE